MIKIEKRGFGYKIVFGGILKIADISEFKSELLVYINNSKENFSIYYDLRSIQYFAKDAQSEFNSFKTLLKAKGLIRSAVIFNRSGDETKIEIVKIPSDQTERVLYSSMEMNFEIVGINWLTREIDPNIEIAGRRREKAKNAESQS
jgi:hypothetical protein